MNWVRIPNAQQCFCVCMSLRNTVLMGHYHGTLTEYDPTTSTSRDVLFLGHGHICHIITGGSHHVVADSNGYIAVYTDDVHRREVCSYDTHTLPIAIATHRGRVVIATATGRLVSCEIGLGVVWDIAMPCVVCGVGIDPVSEEVVVVGSDHRLYSVVEGAIEPLPITITATAITYLGPDVVIGTSSGVVKKLYGDSSNLVNMGLGHDVTEIFFSGALFIRIGRDAWHVAFDKTTKSIPMPEGLVGTVEGFHGRVRDGTAILEVVVSSGTNVWMGRVKMEA